MRLLLGAIRDVLNPIGLAKEAESQSFCSTREQHENLGLQRRARPQIDDNPKIILQRSNIPQRIIRFCVSRQLHRIYDMERPQIDPDLRALIRRMSIEHPLWGAPRIHGETAEARFEVAQSSVAKYMVMRAGPPSQGWGTFLRNHASDRHGSVRSPNPLASICPMPSSSFD
jgi:hypothetical protein